MLADRYRRWKPLCRQSACAAPDPSDVDLVRGERASTASRCSQCSYGTSLNQRTRPNRVRRFRCRRTGPAPAPSADRRSRSCRRGHHQVAVAVPRRIRPGHSESATARSACTAVHVRGRRAWGRRDRSARRTSAINRTLSTGLPALTPGTVRPLPLGWSGCPALSGARRMRLFGPDSRSGHVFGCVRPGSHWDGCRRWWVSGSGRAWSKVLGTCGFDADCGSHESVHAVGLDRCLGLGPRRRGAGACVRGRSAARLPARPARHPRTTHRIHPGSPTPAAPAGERASPRHTHHRHAGHRRIATTAG